MTSESAMEGLRTTVMEDGLCTGCGACVNLCPYFTNYRDRTVILHRCDQAEGACREVCPRTPTDLTALSRVLFEPKDLTPEAGAIKDFLITRAADDSVREKAQHGGTVTALMSLALEEGLVDTAVLAGEGERFLPAGVGVDDPGQVLDRAKSSFVVSPTLAAVNSLAQRDSGRLGVVATPCQALALAKMKKSDLVKVRAIAHKVSLVIGLFCGWAFDWRGLKAILEQKTDLAGIIKLDIPPSRYHFLVVETREGDLEIPLDQVTDCVRTSCGFCSDLTAEFSDISVGSARLPEGWAEAKGWNQVIVRTETGRELLALAKRRKRLEFRPVPPGNLDRLKKAAAKKKREAAASLEARSGRPGDLGSASAGAEALPDPTPQTKGD